MEVFLKEERGQESGGWSHQRVLEHLQAGHPSVVLSSHQRLQAFILFIHVNDVVEVCYLETAPKDRRQGCMQKLLGSLLSQFSGCHFWLDVHEENREARSLYEKMGFKTTGLRRGYYRDGGDCFQLTRQAGPN